MSARLASVHDILYLMFTAGHLSSHPDRGIRADLCHEALRLALLLADHALTGGPETCALAALMQLHVARLPARLAGDGGLTLLEEQDRSLWNPAGIAAGLALLARSAQGETFTRFHAEAGIAAEHCMASSFAATRWERIVALYDLLERVAPSMMNHLNRAVALAEVSGPRHALAALAGLAPPPWLAAGYLWNAVLADLYLRSGDMPPAATHRRIALAAAPSDAIRVALERRLAAAP